MHHHAPITRRVPKVVRKGTSEELLTRRQPLLQQSKTTPLPSPKHGLCGGSTAAEVCGGTTAGCAAVWCCCPCGIVNLLVLAVYKVPAGLCRKALHRRRRRRLIKRGSLPANGNGGCPHRYDERERSEKDWLELKMLSKAGETGAAVATEEEELEREMWRTFYGTGFWRSLSQSETTPSLGSSLG